MIFLLTILPITVVFAWLNARIICWLNVNTWCFQDEFWSFIGVACLGVPIIRAFDQSAYSMVHPLCFATLFVIFLMVRAVYRQMIDVTVANSTRSARDG